ARESRGSSLGTDLRMARRLGRDDLCVRAAFVLEPPPIDHGRARCPAGTRRASAVFRSRQSQSAADVARSVRDGRPYVRSRHERTELRNSPEESRATELSVGQPSARALELAAAASVAQAVAAQTRLAADLEIVARVPGVSRAPELQTEDRPEVRMMAPAAAVRRGAASGARVVSLLACVRSCLREGRQHRQRENEGRNENGLAENIASRVREI